MTDERSPLDSIPAEWRKVATFPGPYGPEEHEAVNVKGMLFLALASEKPEAQPFRRWAAEAIACIQEHGCYPAPKALLRRGRALVQTEPDAVFSRLELVTGPLPRKGA